ncbi:MAG: sigma-70 family RNA polymerase sigma factor [Erysipelotrichaceae bacterium]|nr:sigma-70 family RNA polymerase sigma factor [Erysipelotrichaceae bacterium]
MQQTDNREIQALMQSAINDKNDAVKLLKYFRLSMLSEAELYFSDGNDAKDAVIQAFKNAYPYFSETDASHLKDWLNQYVQNECIHRILPLTASSAPAYTDSDEIPAKVKGIPEDPEKIKKLLRSVLGYLNPAERAVCVLKYRDQLSVEQIAEKCESNAETVRSILSEAKQKLKDNNANTGAIYAMINRLYPFYEEKEETIQPFVLERTSQLSDEEEEFKTSVHELRLFFEGRAASKNNIADSDIDDEDMSPEDIEKTFEMKAIRSLGKNEVDDTASSAKMIMAAAMAAESDKKVSEREYNPREYWLKRIIVIVLFAILAVGIGVAYAIIRTNHTEKPEPVNTTETETPAPEETTETTASPEPTEETVPEDASIGTAFILVTDLTMRKGPGVIYEQNGMAEPLQTYTVYEVTEADGYTWYRVGDEQWVPDLQSQFVTYTPKS